MLAMLATEIMYTKIIRHMKLNDCQEFMQNMTQLHMNPEMNKVITCLLQQEKNKKQYELKCTGKKKVT